MNILRTVLSAYRHIQYAICSRPLYGVMQPGVEMNTVLFRFEENHGDIVHPCIRYIEEGYLGHHWWMVYTPYYKSDASLENPILCYAEGNNPNTPPTEWKFYCLVNEKPTDGYNSDPTLLYEDGTLYVFWRENYDNNLRGCFRATYVAKVVENGVEKMIKPLLATPDSEEDAETCPCFMPTKDGKVMAYGMHLRFHSPRIKGMKQPWKGIVSKLSLITDLLGSYSQQKHYGLAIWRQGGNDWLMPFEHKKTVKFKNCNALYRPWHMDFFDWQGKRYCVVQTNQCNADIALAVSGDNENFTFYKRPLITNDTIGMLGIYKPCAGVTSDGHFYLYYTAQDKNNRSQNKLYLTMCQFREILRIIDV